MQKQVYEHISKISQDPIAQRKVCKYCGSDFPIFQGDQKMLEKLAPVVGDQKIDLPLPNACPDCRERKRLIFRKERHFYKRKCDCCDKNIVSIYHKESDFKVYCIECWYSDKYSPKDFAQDIDREKPVLDQMYQLNKSVPTLSLHNGTTGQNSDFTQHSEFVKNCYLSGAIVNAEDVLYSIGISKCDTLVDVGLSTGVSIAHDSITLVNSQRIFSSYSITNSSYVRFSDNIENSNYILLSSGVKNQNYVYKNKQLNKEEREQKKEELLNIMKTHSGTKKLQQIHQEVKKNTIHKSTNLVATENCIGNEISDSKDVHIGFDLSNIDQGRYLSYSRDCKSVMDVYAAYAKTEKCYNSESLGEGSYACYFSFVPWASSHVYYSAWSIYGCKNIFASVGTKENMNNIIINKEYTEKEREETAVKLINKMKEEGLWGEYLDPSLAYFPYNDTVANDYHPVQKIVIDGQEKIINPNGTGTVHIQEPNKFLSKAILDLGGDQKIPIIWRTKDHEINIPDQIETIKAQDIPDSVEDIDDNILNKAIICEISGRPFKILSRELNFYRKYGIPIPRTHYDIRHEERLKLKTPRKLFLRKCDKCGKDTLSVYDENIGFKVYCESCYNEEIY